MKRLFLILALLSWPFVASAGDIYRTALTYHGTASVSAIAQTTAMATGIEAFKLTCVKACYYAVEVSNGKNIISLTTQMAATNVTSSLLNDGRSVTHLIGSGEFVIVIRASADGLFTITELTK